MFYNMKD